jgi:small subunit ribosomal protein S9
LTEQDERDITREDTAPGVPEETPIEAATEAAEAPAEAAEGTPEAAEGTPEAAEGTPEAAEGTPEAAEAPAETAEAPAAPAAEVEAPAMPAPEDVPPEAVAPEPETVEAQPGEEAVSPAPDTSPAPEQAPRSPADMAADARYTATGKRKSSVARVILMPGTGQFRLNGRPLEVYFPRRTHQVVVQQPLETAGYVGAVDVVARIHGGGISGQADAVRHGIAKALIEADPALRGELKRRQLLTRDPRVKERRKAGLKKARKRPQFSKR